MHIFNVTGSSLFNVTESLLTNVTDSLHKNIKNNKHGHVDPGNDWVLGVMFFIIMLGLCFGGCGNCK